MNKIILWTSAHREFAVDKLKIPPDKIRLVHYFADQRFWRPAHQDGNMICAAGVEMRDYPTLIEAMRGLEIPCHIAAGIARGKLFDTVRAIYEIKDLPSSMTVGSLSAVELRELYTKSRFVVVPLLPSDSDNGLTVILEAMAMGKTVICSRTKGQRDVIVEGVTGLYVPQGDPLALRQAILYLWEHPEIAERMGRAGRERIEQHFTWDEFIKSMKETIEEVAGRQYDRQPTTCHPHDAEKVYAARS